MAFVRPAQAMQIQSLIHKRDVRQILPTSSCAQTHILAMSLFNGELLANSIVRHYLYPR